MGQNIDLNEVLGCGVDKKILMVCDKDCVKDDIKKYIRDNIGDCIKCCKML